MFYPDFRNDVLLFFLLGIMDWITLRGINISHPRPIFEDDLPFPKVGYVSSLEGRKLLFAFFSFPFTFFYFLSFPDYSLSISINQLSPNVHLLLVPPYSSLLVQKLWR